MHTRVKSFAGIINFRDFGGYPTRSGGRVKHGLLYRSAHFGEATPEDLAALAAYGIGFVVDLRRNTERRQYPARWPAGERPHLVTHNSGDDPEAAHITFVRDPELTAARVSEYMRNDYEKNPFKERYVALYSTFLKRLAAGDGPALVHCMAGKDRTGIICAVLLKLLGVSDEDVVDDYLMTNRVRTEAEFELRARQFNEMVGRPVDPGIIRPMWMVDADYLAAALAAIERESGSVEAYVDRVLGVSAAERESLNRLCIEAS